MIDCRRRARFIALCLVGLFVGPPPAMSQHSAARVATRFLAELRRDALDR